MGLVYLDDIRLNAEVSGPVGGPAVVLLHALGTNLTIWDEVVSLLPSGCRVLRFDQRGHGLSDVPEPPYAMGALIRDGERMMAHFGLRDAVVVGLSLGGLVAQGLAVKRLDLVRGMVLSNTAAKIGSVQMWGARVASVQAEGLAAYAPGAMERMFGRRWQEVAGMPRVRAMLEGMDVRGWVGCASAIAGTDFYTPTAGLTLPTLAIAGAHDGTTPPDLVRETADLILGSRWHLMRGAGHLPMVEKPAEYAGVIAEFLRSIGHV
ncbi:alpha/beta fold hydrolase [Cypionkella psychrotolerans]|uniref:alpha/beta fold hydrolase n=1 Tax=Cypionkella psychrotolerans TaxID=1678131 RepID=UPI0006B69798|nr:alpha/beta fold hydrolase [Cypionkella psychrotolerans]